MNLEMKHAQKSNKNFPNSLLLQNPIVQPAKNGAVSLVRNIKMQRDDQLIVAIKLMQDEKARDS